MKHRIFRWEEQVGLRAIAELVAQPALCGGPPLPTEQREVDLFLGRAKLTGILSGGDMMLADHGEALERAQRLWRAPEFLSDVVALLRDEVKFPSPVAELLAPLMLCEYVEWADGGPPVRVTFDEPDAAALARGLVQMIDRVTGAPIGLPRGTPAGGSLPPCAYSSTCPLQPPGAAATFRRYLPSGQEPVEPPDFLREQAQWYFDVEVVARQVVPFENPFTVSRVAERLHGMRDVAHGLAHEFSDTCGCEDKVSSGIREIKQLLGLMTG